MNQRQLSYFLEVYNKENIARAAQTLYISPQALSKTISALEQELSVTLFIRKPNGIEPTKDATKLAAHAKNIIEEYNFIENKLFEGNEETKLLPVPCSYDVPQSIAPDFFYEFFSDNPNIRVQMKEYPDNEITRQLINNEAELAIIPGTFEPETELKTEQLFTDRFCIVMNKKHKLAGKKEITFDDLKNEKLVVKDMSTVTSIVQRNLFLQNGITLNVILETTDAHLIHKMAEENYAVGMTLSFLANKIKSESVVWVPFENDIFKKTLYLTYKNDFSLSKEASIFRETLMRYFDTKEFVKKH